MKKLSEIALKIEENKKTVEVLPTGFPMIDRYLDGGFLKKELIVLGAKTGGGKSLIGATIFKNVAMSGFKSAYFSLEISNEMVVSRLIGAQANINPTRIMISQLEQFEYDKKNDAKAELSVYEEFMHFYDDIYQLNLICKEVVDNKYDFIVVDFIQNIMTGKSDEYERLSLVALTLQKLAKQANCCVLVLSQLSNLVTREKRSSVVEYKGSGSIGTVCDLGFFIEDSDLENNLQLRLRKNRRGVSGGIFNFEIRIPGGGIISK